MVARGENKVTNRGKEWGESGGGGGGGVTLMARVTEVEDGSDPRTGVTRSGELGTWVTQVQHTGDSS